MALAGHLNTLALYKYCTFVEFNDTLAWNASLGFMFGAIDLCTERHDPSKAKSQPCYLGPSFSSTRGPCSCHSCFVIHMFSLSAIWCVERIRQYA